MNEISISTTATTIGDLSSQSVISSNNTDGFLFNISTPTKSDNIYSLAKAFLSIESMTNKKLQKLCYYAKAWYLALYDQNLIEESFEAWVHGAVQPALYHYYKEYGYDLIPKNSSTSNIPEEFLSFAKEIFDAYGRFSGDQLEDINHTELPWINARKGYEPWEACNCVISENDMKEYYRKMIDNGKNTST